MKDLPHSETALLFLLLSLDKADPPRLDNESNTHCRVLLGQTLGGGPAGAPGDIPEVRAGVAGNDEAQLHLRFAHRKNDLARFLHLSFSNMNLNMHQ